MTLTIFNLKHVHPSWRTCIEQALANMDQDYLRELVNEKDWLPGPEAIFNAFTQPLDSVSYVLFGESPYPRKESANGYAFWDAAVNELWSAAGMSKKVNRATSLRNMMKMLLVAEGLLPKTSHDQAAIAKLNKTQLAQTNTEFFTNLLNHGFLLLNATLVLRTTCKPQKDAKYWQPFMQHVLNCLLSENPNVQLILFGKIANPIENLITHYKGVRKLHAEHPYNLSFITNPDVLNFFKPLHLLNAKRAT